MSNCFGKMNVPLVGDSLNLFRRLGATISLYFSPGNKQPSEISEFQLALKMNQLLEALEYQAQCHTPHFNFWQTGTDEFYIKVSVTDTTLKLSLPPLLGF